MLTWQSREDGPWISHDCVGPIFNLVSCDRERTIHLVETTVILGVIRYMQLNLILNGIKRYICLNILTIITVAFLQQVS